MVLIWRIEEVTDALQNVILQHADIRTFIRHYEVDVDVDVQGIIRKTGSQTPLVRFACSLSASIDPDRPYWLSTDESKSLNQLPEIRKRQQAVVERKEKWKNRETKLERATLAWRASSGYLSDKASTGRLRQLPEKLELFQDRVPLDKQGTKEHGVFGVTDQVSILVFFAGTGRDFSRSHVLPDPLYKGNILKHLLLMR